MQEDEGEARFEGGAHDVLFPWGYAGRYQDGTCTCLLQVIVAGLRDLFGRHASGALHLQALWFGQQKAVADGGTFVGANLHMALHAEVIGEQALYQKALGVIAQVIFPRFQLPLAVKDAVGIAFAPEEALLGGVAVCSTATLSL